MAKSKWQKQTLRMRKDHLWKASPGCNVFVADRGAVRFDYPHDWVVIPGDTATDPIKFHDKQPPDDDCVLQMTLFRLNPEFDWSGLPLPTMLADCVKGEDRGVTVLGPVRVVRRQDLELVWTETSWLEEKEQREARSRHCLARSGTIVPFFTLDFWPEHAARWDPVWETLLNSLRLGEYIADPRKGARYGYG
jgi:hypothetical protein